MRILLPCELGILAEIRSNESIVGLISLMVNALADTQSRGLLWLLWFQSLKDLFGNTLSFNDGQLTGIRPQDVVNQLRNFGLQNLQIFSFNQDSSEFEEIGDRVSHGFEFLLLLFLDVDQVTKKKTDNKQEGNAEQESFGEGENSCAVDYQNVETTGDHSPNNKSLRILSCCCHHQYDEEKEIEIRVSLVGQINGYRNHHDIQGNQHDDDSRIAEILQRENKESGNEDNGQGDQHQDRNSFSLLYGWVKGKKIGHTQDQQPLKPKEVLPLLRRDSTHIHCYHKWASENKRHGACEVSPCYTSGLWRRHN